METYQQHSERSSCVFLMLQRTKLAFRMFLVSQTAMLMLHCSLQTILSMELCRSALEPMHKAIEAMQWKTQLHLDATTMQSADTRLHSEMLTKQTTWESPSAQAMVHLLLTLLQWVAMARLQIVH